MTEPHAETPIREEPLAVGETAPDFTLPAVADGGEPYDVTLSALVKGGPVMLIFYQDDGMPICTRELQAFAQESELLDRGRGTGLRHQHQRHWLTRQVPRARPLPVPAHQRLLRRRREELRHVGQRRTEVEARRGGRGTGPARAVRPAALQSRQRQYVRGYLPGSWAGVISAGAATVDVVAGNARRRRAATQNDATTTPLADSAADAGVHPTTRRMTSAAASAANIAPASARTASVVRSLSLT